MSSLLEARHCDLGWLMTTLNANRVRQALEEVQRWQEARRRGENPEGSPAEMQQRLLTAAQLPGALEPGVAAHIDELARAMFADGFRHPALVQQLEAPQLRRSIEIFRELAAGAPDLGVQRTWKDEAGRRIDERGRFVHTREIGETDDLTVSILTRLANNGSKRDAIANVNGEFDVIAQVGDLERVVRERFRGASLRHELGANPERAFKELTNPDDILAWARADAEGNGSALNVLVGVRRGEIAREQRKVWLQAYAALVPDEIRAEWGRQMKGLVEKGLIDAPVDLPASLG
jgi:hypothetical protein